MQDFSHILTPSPNHRNECEDMPTPVNGKPPINGDANVLLPDNSQLFRTTCSDGGYTTQAIFVGTRFGTICPKVKSGKAPPLVLLGGADSHDLVVVEILIADYRIPFLLFVISCNPIITLRPQGSYYMQYRYIIAHPCQILPTVSGILKHFKIRPTQPWVIFLPILQP